MAAIMRGKNCDAVFSGLTDSEGFALARQSCTGKECLPHQLIWGSFAKYLKNNPLPENKKTLLLNVTGRGPCRNGMFTLANEIALEKMGLDDKVGLMTFGYSGERLLTSAWFSIVTTDILRYKIVVLGLVIPKTPPGAKTWM